jgi:heat shock protein HtpX
MWEEIRANRRRAALLVAAMALLLMATGYALAEYAARGAGLVGMILAFIIWIVHSLISYFAGDRILLSMAGARQIQKTDHPVLFNVVEEMCVASGLTHVPDIYIIDDDALNAFATGRDPEHAVVAVTGGLLKELDRTELQGVIGHELSHINNRDVLYMTMLAVMMGTIIFLAEIGTRMMRVGGVGQTRTSGRRRGGSGGGFAAILLIVAIVLMILAPVIARLLYMAVSRRREYLADASSALYTRYPEGLASALEKLGHSTHMLRSVSAATAPMYIVNPMPVTGSASVNDLSATHPPISERIRILRSMGTSAGLGSYNEAFQKVTGRPVGVVPFAAVREAKDVPAELRLQPAAAPVPVPAIAPPLSKVDRVRQTTDLLWSLNDFIFIDCPCGTKLKIPPVYRGKRIECPHCARVHVAQAA